MRILPFLFLAFFFIACNNDSSNSKEEPTTSTTKQDPVASAESSTTQTDAASTDKPSGPKATPKDVLLHQGSSKKWFISAVNAYSGGNLTNFQQAIASDKKEVKPSITFSSDYTFVLDAGSDLTINFVWNNISVSTNTLEGTWEVDLPKQFLRFILVLEDPEQNRRGRLTMNCPYASLNENLVEADINLQFLGDHFQLFTGNFELTPAN